MSTSNETGIDALIDGYELELRCAHCASCNRRPLGWVRAHREMSCHACDELVILDTSRIRDLIRDTTRQLRSLNESLQTNAARWTRAGESAAPSTANPPTSRADRERVRALLLAARAAEGLLTQATHEARPAERGLFMQAAAELHQNVKGLCGTSPKPTELELVIEAVGRKLDVARRGLGERPSGDGDEDRSPAEHGSHHGLP